jgi:hypothetical protein
MRRDTLLSLVAWSNFLLHHAGITCHDVFIVANQIHQGPVTRDFEDFSVQLDEEFLGKLPVARDLFPVQLNREPSGKLLVVVGIGNSQNPRSRGASIIGNGVGDSNKGSNQTL